MTRLLLVALTGLLPAVGARGQVLTFAFPGGDIPDDSSAGGVLLAGVVPGGGGGVIEKLRVTLAISGIAGGPVFNGDYYAYLTHEDGLGTPGFSVLLNRVGSSPSNPFGYDDNGISVTFDDTPGVGQDIHVYRQVLFGNEGTAILAPGLLEGIWMTDARTTDPSAVLGTDPRSATLDSFLGLNPAGLWRLYVQDLSGGGVGKVDHWNLEITTSAVVPEPAEFALVAGLALGTFAFWRRRAKA